MTKPTTIQNFIGTFTRKVTSNVPLISYKNPW